MAPSTSPPPCGNTKPATNEGAGKKIITAHRAGQWKSFPLDFFFSFFLPSCSRNPITGTQCLQRGINPTVRSPCLSPGEARGTVWSDWSDWSGVQRASLQPRSLLAAASLLQGNISGQVSLQWSHLEMTVWDGMMGRSWKSFL